MEEQDFNDREILEVDESNKKGTKVSINDKQFVLGPCIVNILLAVIAVSIMAIVKICGVYFGIMGGTFAGILMLFVYVLTIFGAVWALVRNKKPTLEFYINAIALAIAFMAF